MSSKEMSSKDRPRAPGARAADVQARAGDVEARAGDAGARAGNVEARPPARPPQPKRDIRAALGYREPPSVSSQSRQKPTSWVGLFFWYMKPPRKLKITREGKYYLGITLGVGFAAINTGNNLLYLLLGMLLSLIVVSGVMSDLSLRQLTVTRRLPARAQVGRAHLVEIEVYNHKKRVPSYAIEVEDLRASQPADKRCFFLKISPTSAQVAAYRRTPAKRGRDRHTGFRIATRFPFGLFEKSREVDAEGDLIIYPAVDPVRLPIDEAGRAEGGGGAMGRGGGDETYSLRQMRDGDDPRDIYWKKSTVSDQLVMRERARETRPDVRLVVDNVRPTGAGEGFSAIFEKRIRDVASRAVAHIKRGDGVAVSSTSGDRVRGDRSLGIDPVLRFLALLEAIDEAKLAALRKARVPGAAPQRAGGVYITSPIRLGSKAPASGAGPASAKAAPEPQEKRPDAAKERA